MKNLKKLLAFAAVSAVCCCTAAFTACEPKEHEHNWGEWEITTPATCTQKGEEIRVCADDTEHVETRSIDATGHDWEDWTLTTPATCLTAGEETRVCKHDNLHTETRSVGEAAGHSWNDGEITTPATCTEDGEITFTCTAEDCGKTKTETAFALDHDWGVWTEKTPATCTAAKTEQRSCNHDDKHTETRTVGEAVGHKWDDGNVTTPPTEEAAGEKTFTCTVTGCGATKKESVPELGHVHSYTGEWQMDASGHWKSCDGVDCNEKSMQAEHDFDDGEVTVTATCTDAGVKTFTCETCGFEKTETVPVDATAHKWGEWADKTDATCTAAKTQERVCSHNSGHTETRSVGEAEGHSWDEGAVTTSATCTENGEMTFNCTVNGCDGTKTQSVAVDPSAHQWGEWEEKTAATCTDATVEERICGHNREHTETRSSGEPLGHDYQYTVTKGEQKSKVEFKCMNCGDNDESKAYECDAVVNADGKYTFSATSDNSYLFENTTAKTYFVEATAKMNYVSFFAAKEGKYEFTFTHLTDGVTNLYNMYLDSSGLARITSTQIVVNPAYDGAVEAVCDGAYNSTNVNKLAFNVNADMVGKTFSFGLQTKTADTAPVKFLINATMPEMNKVGYGENTVAITQTNSFVDIYAFVVSETKCYSITVPTAIGVSLDGNDLTDGSGTEGTVSVNFEATAGQTVLFVFSGATTGDYVVTIGDEIIKKLTVGCEQIEVKMIAGEAGRLVVGEDVAEGRYKVVISGAFLTSRATGCGYLYFNLNCANDYGAVTAGGMLMQFPVAQAKNDWEPVCNKTPWTVTLTLKAGDVIYLAPAASTVPAGNAIGSIFVTLEAAN